MTNHGKTRLFAGAGFSVLRTGTQVIGGLYRRYPQEAGGASGNGWESLTNGLPQNPDVRAMVVHPTHPDVIYVGTQDGPYRSIDGGDHWEKLGFPDRNAAIWTISIHPTRHNILYAGTAPVALYRSLDGGDNWHRLPNAKSPAHCEREGFDTRTIRITADPNRPDDVYAALEVSGVIHSADGGETWTDKSASLMKFAEQPRYQSNVGGRHCGHCEGMLDSHALAISAAAPDTSFLAIRMGVFRSDDRGATWHDTEIGRFSPLTYCRDVIVSPHDARMMYACLSPAAFSQDGSLYRSDDLAQNWRRIDHGIKAESTLMSVCVHPRDAAQVYSVTRAGQVFGTQDAGVSWSEYRLPQGVHDVYAVACS